MILDSKSAFKRIAPATVRSVALAACLATPAILFPLALPGCDGGAESIDASSQALRAHHPPSAAVGAVSPSGTTIPPATAIVDNQNSTWTVSGGVIYKDGATAGYSANVTTLLFYNGTIYQQNSAGGWWSWDGSGWADASDPRGGTTPSNPSTAGMTGNFTVSSSAGFKDPSGGSWDMRGLNAGVQDALQGFGNVLRDYPGLTAIRLNCVPGSDSNDSISQVVDEYTSKGVVVEVEDHSGVGDNADWYAQMAQLFKGNSHVFLETPNEPSAANTAQNQITIINAIRNAGFTNPIGLQPIGGYDFSNIATVTGAVGSSQLFITPHIYDDTTDPNGPANYVAGDIQASHDLGLFPVIDEFGDALDGYTRNPQGPAVISAVIAADMSHQAGAVFWAMDNGNHPDGADSAFLTPDGSQLTSVGVGLQDWLK